ncbi:SpaA isopeptide-forming pilin-related protein [Xiamenia xianingshaonis]|uniref:Cna B-type domain-containing protein n=1 Tax=Xiamenia xianingshaonis TaxID=2682776 RepID=A0A9E6MQI8_9ACTN|nr:Cna B-type domain-containing protein [Xiamenia xianingshaonis]NHM14649.1 Cna B-type domain-containing protein [Xiamenia xianingshaonis]QTU84315.1 Cna B-type domain-containing protein [Xiamenia xianingshaonis]
MKRTADIAASFVNDKKKRHREMGFFALAAVMVVLCVVVWLHIEGIATTNEAMCGIPEHTHSEACYTVEYTCDSAEDPDHTHTDECTVKTLTCDMEEHTHDASCYSNPEADVETPEQWAASTEGANLTGDWASDLVAVAQTQIGYAESDQNFQMGEDGERHGYTRYGAWNDNPYGAWDSLFVGFCLDYANVEVSKVPRESGAYAWTAALQRAGAYTPAAGYTPEAGDIVFFDEDGNGKADHTAVVSHVNSDLAQMNIIEGDVNNAVVEEDRTIGESTVLGYCNIAGMQERAESPDGGVVPINKFDPDNASNTKQNMDGESTDSDEPKKPAATTTEGGTDPATNTNNKVEGETNATENNGKPATESGGTTEGGIGTGAGTTEGEGSGTTKPTDPAAGQPTDKPAEGAADNTQSPDKQPVSETGKEQQTTTGTEKKDPAAASDGASIVEEEEKLEKLEADGETQGTEELPEEFYENVAGATLRTLVDQTQKAAAATEATGTDTAIESETSDETTSVMSAKSRTLSLRSMRRTMSPMLLLDAADTLEPTAAGNGIDFKDSITDITVEYRQNQWSGWTPVTDGMKVDGKGQLKFNIAYKLKPETLSKKANKIYYEMPDAVKLVNQENGTVYDEHKNKVGTYSITADGRIEIEFTDNYVEQNQTSEIDGYINIVCDIEQIDTSNGTSIELPFKDDLDIPVLVDKTQEDESKLSVKKSASEYNKSDGAITYKVIVSSTTGTADKVHLEDVLSNAVGTGKVTITGPGDHRVEKDISGSSVSCDLPKFGAGETCTLVYTVKATNLQQNSTTYVSNTATATTITNDGTLKASASTHTEITQKVLEKKGEKTGDGQIKWTVTINQSRLDIGGWTLKDKFNGADYTGKVTLKGESGTEQEVDLPYTFPTGTTGTFTVTYTTPDEAALGSTQAMNQAILDPADPANPYAPDITDDVYGPEHNQSNSPLRKTGTGSVEQTQTDEKGEKTYAVNSWNVSIRPDQAPLKAGWTFTDELQDNQWFTTEQAVELLDRLKASADGADCGDCTVNLWGTDAGNSWVGPHGAPQSGVKYTKIEVTFKKDLATGKEISFSYSSTADVTGATGTKEFRNGSYIVSNGYRVDSSSKDEYRPTKPVLTKQDSKDGSNNETTYHKHNDNEGVFEWKLNLTMPVKYEGGDLVLTEHLPEGVDLVRFSLYGKNANGNDAFTPVDLAKEGERTVTVADESYTIGFSKSEENTVTVIIPEALAKLTDSSTVPTTLVKAYRFYVGVKVPEGYKWEVNEETTVGTATLANSAQVTDSEHTFTSEDGQTQVITKDERPSVLSKSHGKYLENTSSFAANVIPYSLDINPEGKDLLPAAVAGGENPDKLTLIDIVSLEYNPYYLTTATLVPDSVKVYKADSSNNKGEDITNACPYTYEEEIKDGKQIQTLKITIPDGQHLIVEYQYQLAADGGRWTNVNNQASLEGVTKFIGDSTDSTQLQVTESSAGAQIKGLTFYKIDRDNAQATIPGAKFDLYQYKKEKGDYEKVKAEPLVSGSKGAIKLDKLAYNTAYKLVEIEAPEGYKINDDPCCFYVFHSDTTTYPLSLPEGFDGVAYREGQPAYFKDKEKKLDEIEIKKSWLDESGHELTENLPEVTFDVYRVWSEQAPGAFDPNTVNLDTIQESDTVKKVGTYTLPDNGKWEKTIGNLEYSTSDAQNNVTGYYYYFIKETNPPAGYVSLVEQQGITTGETFMVENKKLATTDISVQKQWQDVDGNELTNVDVGTATPDKIAAKVMRYRIPADEVVPFDLRLIENGSNNTLYNYTAYVERGSKVTVSLILPCQGDWNDSKWIGCSQSGSYSNQEFKKDVQATSQLDEAKYLGKAVYSHTFETVPEGGVVDLYGLNAEDLADVPATVTSKSPDASVRELDKDYEPQIIELTASNGWSKTLDELPVCSLPEGDVAPAYYYQYFIVEDQSDNGFIQDFGKTQNNNGIQNGLITLVNKKDDTPKTSITVNKQWLDQNGNQLANKTTGEAKVQLHQVRNEGEEVKVNVVDRATGESLYPPVPLSDVAFGDNVKIKIYFKPGSGWNFGDSATDVAANVSGLANAKVGYASGTYDPIITGTVADNLIVMRIGPNGFGATYQVSNVTYEKLSSGASSSRSSASTGDDASAAGSESVALGEPVTLQWDEDPAKSWTHTWTDLPTAYQDPITGKKYNCTYYVTEEKVEGYDLVTEQATGISESTAIAGGANDDTITLKNKDDGLGKTNINIQKRWFDAKGNTIQDQELLPNEINVQVKRYRTTGDVKQVPLKVELAYKKHSYSWETDTFSYETNLEQGASATISLRLPYIQGRGDKDESYKFGEYEFKRDPEATAMLGSSKEAIYTYTIDKVPESGITISGEEKEHRISGINNEKIGVTSERAFTDDDKDPDFSETLTIKKSDNWKAQLKDLPVEGTKDGASYKYYYYLAEEKAIPGFTLDVEQTKHNGGIQSGSIVLANKNTTSLTAQKQWVDEDGNIVEKKDGFVQLQLYRYAHAIPENKHVGTELKVGCIIQNDNVHYDEYMPEVEKGDKIKVTFRVPDEASFNQLKWYHNSSFPVGRPIAVNGLNVTSDPVIDSASQTVYVEGIVDDDPSTPVELKVYLVDSNLLTLLNYKIEDSDVSWGIIEHAAAQDNDGEVLLKKEKVPGHEDPVTVEPGTYWSTTWTELPSSGILEKENGEKVEVVYTYEVEELPGQYEQDGPTEYVHTSDGGVIATITNKVSDKTSITVQKVWQDSNGADISNDKTGSSVAVTLMQQKFDKNGNKVSDKPYGGSVTVIYGSADQPWKHTYEDLPLTGTENGKKYTYKYYVEEKIAQENTNYQWVSMTTGGDDSQSLATIENNAIKGEADGVTSGTIVITNKEFEEPGYVLPATGGTGVVPYWALGSLLVAAGALGIACRRRFGRLGERRSE